MILPPARGLSPCRESGGVDYTTRRLAPYTTEDGSVVSIRSLRERFGESQPEFARRVGVSLDTVRSWEQGRRRPSATARQLLHLLAADLERRAKRRRRA
jgi:DNA-binding transcriptional regulator YiaG